MEQIKRVAQINKNWAMINAFCGAALIAYGVRCIYDAGKNKALQWYCEALIENKSK